MPTMDPMGAARVVLHNLSWETYEAVLRDVGDDGPRMAYDRGELRGRDLDLAVDPPPDLAIEIDLRRSNLDKLGIYAALGVPEIWSHDGKRVIVHLLQPSGTFTDGETSAAFPGLPLAELVKFLDRIGKEGETQLVRAFRSWVREKFGTPEK